MKTAIVSWLVAINLLAFLAFGWDKLAARRGRRRIPESRLLLFAFLLGAPGAWLGSRAFRHKTVKRGFRIKFALVTLLEFALIVAGCWLAYG